MQSDYLKNLVSFVQTARLGSFTAAADVLNITPAAVSKNVAVLEKNLNIRLFNRTTRSLSLTAEGGQFFEQSHLALDILEQAVQDLGRAANEVSGKVKISVSNTIGRNLILPHLAELMSRYPQLSLELDFDDHVIDFVQGGFDLAVRGGNIVESNLIARKIGLLKTVLAASPDYLAKHGKPQTIADIARHRTILHRFESGKFSPWTFKQKDGHINLDISQPTLILTDPEAVTQACLDGIGIAKVPLYLAGKHLKSGHLLPLFAKEFDGGRFELVLQYPHRNQLPVRVKAVIEFLLEKMKAALE